jgi:hypothetical protein
LYKKGFTRTEEELIKSKCHEIIDYQQQPQQHQESNQFSAELVRPVKKRNRRGGLALLVDTNFHYPADLSAQFPAAIEQENLSNKRKYIKNQLYI